MGQSINGVVYELHRRGFNDPTTLAIILTEMSFRPLRFRIIEYMSYLFLGQKRTIGIAQIGVWHWEKNASNRRDVLKLAFSPEANYTLCKEISGIETSADLQTALIKYNRLPSTLYVETVISNLSLVNELANSGSKQ